MKGLLSRQAVVVARFDTPHFIFEGCGLNSEEAMVALRKTLAEHGRQYSLRKNWMRDCATKWEEEVSFTTYSVGSGYRDRDLIV